MPRTQKNPPPASWRRLVIEYIATHPDRPLKARALARELGVPEEQYAEFRQIIRQMLADGSLAYGSGRKLTLPERTGTLVGVFRAHRRGFGFIESPGRPDLYVPRGRKRGALDGDTVQARLIKPRRRGAEPRAEVVRIAERARIRWVGVLGQLGSRWIVHPLGKTPMPLVTITGPTECSAQPGDMVVVEPVEGTIHGRSAHGVIVENLGPADDTQTKIRAIVRRYALREQFSAGVQAAAERAVSDFSIKDVSGREDLRRLLTITIDPPDARDFDDAISVRQLRGGQYELGVHIADVAHFVKPGDPLDEEARLRGTSVYFPGYALPMLPEPLSSDVCSLRPGAPRLAKSVFITYDPEARVRATRFANTLIRSRARLTYKQVTAVLEGRSAGLERAVVGLLRHAARLAERIRTRRQTAGMIELAAPEVEIRLDHAGQVVDAGPAETSFSHTLIEMFMVEANEAVARWLTQKGVPHLRRIHPQPQPEAAQHFARLSAAFGQPTSDVLTRASIRAVLDRVRGLPSEPAINFLLLRCMPQACYSPAEEGHFALASEHYCHFTSPIRRYPDLTIHRLLDSSVSGESARSRRRSSPELIAPDELAELGRATSAAERRAQQAEREANTMLLLELMKSKVGGVFDGIITGVMSFGAFVQILPYLAEGIVRVADFGPDAWYFDRSIGQFFGHRTGRIVAIGQQVRVTVVAVDDLRQELTLVPAEGSSFGAAGARRRRRARGQASGRRGRRYGGGRSDLGVW